MTYEECRLKLEETFEGSVITKLKHDELIYYIGDNMEFIGSVGIEVPYIIKTGNSDVMAELSDDIRFQALDLLVKLASTNINNRNCRQKYNLKLRGSIYDDNYLNIMTVEDDCTIVICDDNEELRYYQASFTIDEILSLPERFDVNLKEYDFIAVKN